MKKKFLYLTVISIIAWSNMFAQQGIDKKLFKACILGKTDKINQLIDKGADVNVTGDYEWSFKEIMTLSHGCQFIIKGSMTDKVSALIVATIKRDIKMVETLTDNGADANIKSSKEGITALMVAACNADEIILQILIGSGANMNVKSHHSHDNWPGFTPLHYAVSGCSIDIIKILLDNSAKINVQDSDGNTPLMNTFGYCNGNKEIINLFVARGANLNIKNKSGETALSMANFYELIEIVEVLKDNSAVD